MAPRGCALRNERTGNRAGGPVGGAVSPLPRHYSGAVPNALTDEADMLWAGISLVHDDLSALKMMRKGAMSS